LNNCVKSVMSGQRTSPELDHQDHRVLKHRSISMGPLYALSGYRRTKPVRLRLKRIPRELQSNRSLPTADCRFSSPTWRIAR
jgi:hypothetical protein